MSVSREHVRGVALRGARAELPRLLRFCIVGLSNTAITLCVYALATALGIPPALASAVGFAAGAANGYHWNSRWTFAVRRLRGARSRYVAVQALAAGLSAAGVAAARAGGLARWPAEIVILPVVTVIAYALSRRFVFRDSGEQR